MDDFNIVLIHLNTKSGVLWCVTSIWLEKANIKLKVKAWNQPEWNVKLFFFFHVCITK